MIKSNRAKAKGVIKLPRPRALAAIPKRAALWALYKAYLWSFSSGTSKTTFAVSERIVEYPFGVESTFALPKQAKVALFGCHGDLLTAILRTLGYETHGIDTKAFPLIFKNFYFPPGGCSKDEFRISDFRQAVAISTIEHIYAFSMVTRAAIAKPLGA